MDHDNEQGSPMLPFDTELPAAQIIEMYNDAVEMIWLLQEQLYQAEEDFDAMQQAYDEVCNLYYG